MPKEENLPMKTSRLILACVAFAALFADRPSNQPDVSAAAATEPPPPAARRIGTRKERPKTRQRRSRSMRRTRRSTSSLRRPMKISRNSRSTKRPLRDQPRRSRLLPHSRLPLQKGDRIALIGNTLLERSQEFGHFEAMLQQQFPQHELVVRHLAWSADTIDAAAAARQLCRYRAASDARKGRCDLRRLGFNESFAGEAGLKGVSHAN